jgi:hypothetical protein
MIFKKSAVQGGTVLSNGQRIDFDSNGLFETADQAIIEQLKSIYAVADIKSEHKPIAAKQTAPGAKAVTFGMASSATLAQITK